MQVLSARLGLSSANPVAAGVGAYSSMLETLDGLLGPAPRTSAQWTGFGRVDWACRGAASLHARRDRRALRFPGGGLTRTSETYGTHSYGSSRADEQWLLGRWEAFLTPNLLAVTQGSVGRQIHDDACPRARRPSNKRSTSTTGASCRRSSSIRATASPSAIRRASARAAIPTSISIRRRSS